MADNGSDDGSAELAARGRRAAWSHEPRRGYGSAYLAGFAAARGHTSSWATPTSPTTSARSPASSRALEDGADLVMGNRMDSIHPGAMPWLHRYVGNPLLTGFLNLLLPDRRRATPTAACARFRRDAAAQARPAHARAWSSPPRW